MKALITTVCLIAGLQLTAGAQSAALSRTNTKKPLTVTHPNVDTAMKPKTTPKQGTTTPANGGQKQNMERNKNYGNSGTNLPANNGSTK